MTTESRVLSNIPYTTHNYSNYDIITEETRNIVDVPYYPAQNLVDVSKTINPYAPAVDCYIPFFDQNNIHRLFGLLNRTDARFVFIEFADNARYVQYKFAGNSYPQGRTNYAYSYDGTNLYILGGYSDNRCMNDLWQYNINTDQWVNLNFSLIEKSGNQMPSRRRKSNIVATSTELLLFGGETDTLTINTANTSSFIVPLNDVWSYNLATGIWTNFDPNRILPNRQGHIIFNDATNIKIYIAGGLNDIGVVEPNAIYTVNKITNAVTSTTITAPFVPAANNCCLLIGSYINVFLNNGSVYRWDDTGAQFVLVRSGIAAVNPYNSFYWTIVSTPTYYGNNIGMGTYNVSVAKLYNTSAALQSTKTITLPPVGIQMPSININNAQTFFYGGMYSYQGNNTFNEGTYVLNNTTLNVQEYTFSGTQRPTARVYTSLSYDSYNGRVWLFGGFDGTKFYNDLWYFDLGLRTWTLVHAQDDNLVDVYPPPRQKAGMAIVNSNYIYILGGYSDSNSFNDLWVYNISNDVWEQIHPADNIPWGSVYSIFEWQDYLYLFNGQQLYKYFDTIKQFVAQPFLINGTSTFANNTNAIDPLLSLINAKQYMNTPVSVTCINGHLLVQNSTLLFDVDLDSKEVLNLTTQYGITETIYWLDSYVGIGTTSMASYYTNISSLIPLTQNQLPNSFNHRDSNIPIPNAIIYSVPGNADVQLTYQDNSGVFPIQGEYLPVDKATLLYKGDVSFAGLTSALPGINFADPSVVLNQTINAMGQPTTYPVTPWFLYGQSTSTLNIFKGAQTTLYNDKTNDLYVVYQNGNTLKLNSADNTFFTYYTSLWEGSAFGYHKSQNIIYAFGGIRNSRAVYMQDGILSPSLSFANTDGSANVEKTHNGLIQFNLNINEMNINSIQSYQKTNNATVVDYPIVRDYLVNQIRTYIEGYANNTATNSLDAIKEQVYLSSQPIVDDLSQFDFILEDGTRPSARAFSAYTQIGNKLYMFGGCECVQADSCAGGHFQSPWDTSMPGTMSNSLRVFHGQSPIYNIQNEARLAVCFDMDAKKWTTLTPLVNWRYMASAVPSTNGLFIYIVGGYTDVNCTGISSLITIYDVANNTYENLQGVPSNYLPRALPLVRWLDDDKLLIMYGMYTYPSFNPGDGCPSYTYHHLPINDAWIYDKRSNIMYKAFEDIDIKASLVAKDSFYVGLPTDNKAYSLSVSPEVTPHGSLILKALEWDLVKGVINPLPIIPTSEILTEYSPFATPTLQSIIEQIAVTSGSSNITLNDIINFSYTQTNFRFRYCWVEEYGQYNHKFMFIIGEMAANTGITHLQDVAQGYVECQLRFWYVDLDLPDANRVMHTISYSYPLPLSPVTISYDGSRYIYAIYNKYNIWRLDFKGVLNDSSGSYWYQCPPCLDCNFLGESRTNTSSTDPWNSFFTLPNYLTLISSNGRIARMDTNTFVWYLDKSSAPLPPTKGAKLIAGSELSNQELYLYDLGGISGKVLNIYEQQWDNFFLDMRKTSSVSTSFPSVVENKLWPTFLRRKRMYTMNQLGHILYTWLRIDGVYDVDFQLQDFYDGSEIRIYGDYTLIQNDLNIVVQVFGVTSGWVTIPNTSYSTVINETGWDWDGDYTRRYVHMFIDAQGNVAHKYATLPPNYVSVNLLTGLPSQQPISNIRIYYKNTPSNSNYVSHINQVELISNQTIVDSYDTALGTVPLAIVHMEPLTINDEYSNQFAVYVKNEGDNPATNVVMYAFGNTWIQFNLNPTLTPDAWTIRDENNPFPVATTINPGGSVIVYIRAVNIDERPHSTDLVVRGVYAFA